MAESSVPKPLTINQLIRNNEEYFQSLQTSIIRLQRDQNWNTIIEDIPVIQRVVDRILENFYTGELEFNLQYLNELENLLSGYSLLIARWRSELDTRAEAFVQIGETIRSVKDTYQSATSMVDSSDLPTLNEQWAALLKRLTRADSLFTVQNTETLDLQSKLSALSIGISDAKDEIKEQQRTIRSDYFQKDSPFIWQLHSLTELPELYPILEESVMLNSIILKTYLKRNIGSFVWILVFGVIIYFWFVYLVKKIRKEK